MDGAFIIILLAAVTIVFAIGYVANARYRNDEDVTDDREAPWEED